MPLLRSKSFRKIRIQELSTDKTIYMTYYTVSRTILSLQIKYILIQHYKLKGESLGNVESVMRQRILKRDYLLRECAFILQYRLAGTAKQRSQSSITMKKIRLSILYLLPSLDAVQQQSQRRSIRLEFKNGKHVSLIQSKLKYKVIL